MRLVASVFPLSGISALFPVNHKAAKKPRGMMPAGTTAQPSGRTRPPALSFHENLFDGRLRPAAIDVCGQK
ncbi:hypothetical protein, partial [Mesorhizobium sp. M7A.F.Ca.CA.002.03.2.1]|uniref:hypothetical protein n=1 Tax=Mesorhizobium sp. M7A.F.Ca.CA.002.03.2.1 TaxID=2496680 RepID=UPI0019D4940E